MNIDELEHAVIAAEVRVLKIQTKLHSWARDDAHRRFDDLFNLVADPSFLLVVGRRCEETKVPVLRVWMAARRHPFRRVRASGFSLTNCV